jgi:hypothetical protein
MGEKYWQFPSYLKACQSQFHGWFWHSCYFSVSEITIFSAGDFDVSFLAQMVAFSFFQLPLHVATNRCISNSMRKSKWRESRKRSELSEMMFRTDKHETRRLQNWFNVVSEYQAGLEWQSIHSWQELHEVGPHAKRDCLKLNSGGRIPEFSSYAFKRYENRDSRNRLGPTRTWLHITHHK